MHTKVKAVAAAAALLTSGLNAYAGKVVDQNTPRDQWGATVLELPYRTYFLVGDDFEKEIHCYYPVTDVEVIITDGDTLTPLTIGYEPMMGDWTDAWHLDDANATMLMARSGGREIHWVGLFKIDRNNNAVLVDQVEGPTPENPYLGPDDDAAGMYIVEIGQPEVPWYIEIRDGKGGVTTRDLDGSPWNPY